VTASVAAQASDRPRPGTGSRRAGVSAVYRVELVKVSAQLLPRLAAVVCLLGPFVFALIMKTQSSAPADTLFGRWVHSSGFAIPFVVLGFAGIAGLPLLTSIVAGDIFAGEDRHGTWKTLLTRSCSRRALFLGKTLAAATSTVAMVTLLALSSLVAGVLVVGTQPLLSLSGALMSPGRALTMVLASWAVALIPALAFTCLGVLFSVASRNSMAGVIGPPVVGLVMVLLSLMGSGVVVRTLMLTSGFEAWHGLQLEPPKYGPLVLGTVVAAAYAYLCLDSARTIMLRRDFAGDTPARTSWPKVLRGILVALVGVAVLAVASMLDRTWITSDRLQASVGATFKNLVVVQQTMLDRTAKTGSFGVFPFCKRERVIGGPSRGSGDDWICALNVNGSQLGQVSVTYSVIVRPNGCYTAEGPDSVVGPLHIRDAQGRTVINPLFAFDGCMISP
jgi:ABC-2 type transport system permease protein